MSSKLLFTEQELNYFSDSIKDSNTIVLLTHIFPDYDAIGSTLALYHFLLNKGKKVIMFSPNKIDKQFFFLPGAQNFKRHLGALNPDLIITIDSANRNRVDGINEIASLSCPILNIDHHHDNPLYGHQNIVKDISSVGELLSHLFIALDHKISLDMATCLYAAICFDTGRFAHSNVTRETFQVAAVLKEIGVNTSLVAEYMDENKSLEDFKLISQAVNAAVLNEKSKYVYTKLPIQETKTTVKVIDYLRLLKGYKVILVFQELEKNRVKISLRSKNDVDVSAFSQQFGGGGHKKAAGILIEGALADVEDRVISALDEYLSHAKN